MFRYFILVCLCVVLYCRTARSFKSWEKNVDAEDQDTRYDDLNGKMILGLTEVEPLEDLDLTEADIDPSMFIWKAMKQSNQQRYNKPEKDTDQLYHPFETPHTAGNKQPDANLSPHYGQTQLYQETEKVLDDSHNTQGVVDHADPKKLTEMFIPVEPELSLPEEKERLVYMSPEEDKDDLYHEKFTNQEFEPVMLDPPSKVRRVYTEPEEDLDALYHN